MESITMHLSQFYSVRHFRWDEHRDVNNLEVATSCLSICSAKFWISSESIRNVYKLAFTNLSECNLSFDWSFFFSAVHWQHIGDSFFILFPRFFFDINSLFALCAQSLSFSSWGSGGLNIEHSIVVHICFIETFNMAAVCL